MSEVVRAMGTPSTVTLEGRWNYPPNKEFEFDSEGKVIKIYN
jgi:hypothetical protein